MNAAMKTSTVNERTIILAIDLGKYKSVACAYDCSTAEARFTTIATTKQELEKLLQRERIDVVVIEACVLAGWTHDLCGTLGIVCKVANTASEAWKFKHVKRKTDKDDALRLAQLEVLGQLPTVTIPPPSTRQWRSLIAARQKLLGRRVAVQNQIRAYLLGQGLPAPRGSRAWSQLGLQGIEQYTRPLEECATEELWQGLLALALTEYRQLLALLEQTEAKLNAQAKQSSAVQILESIPGVGPRTAETVAAYLNDPGRFQNGKQVSAYGGLVPRQFQSGEQDRRGRITRRGPSLLRKILVECAWGLIRYNAWGRAVYQRLTHGGKTHKKQSIVALARKLLVRCWAMLRTKSKWRGDPTVGAAPA
jgi:transposase